MSGAGEVATAAPGSGKILGGMSPLHQALALEVGRWRSDAYPAPDHPAIGEILEWATDVESKAARFEVGVQEDERRFDRGETPVTTEGRKAIALRKLERLYDATTCRPAARGAGWP